MAFPLTPYVSVLEADVYLDDDPIWLNASITEKDKALYYGRVYFDKYYSCVDHDADAPTDSVKYANALLGNLYFKNTLFAKDPAQRIGLKRVKAGSVESETEYLGGLTIITTNEVDAVLASECTKLAGSLNIDVVRV